MTTDTPMSGVELQSALQRGLLHPSSPEPRSVREVLVAAHRMARYAINAAHALHDRDAETAERAFYDVAIYGRAVTQVLQNLKTVIEDRDSFDDFWKPYADEMKKDELCRYFNKARNLILKQGGPYDLNRVLQLTGEDVDSIVAALEARHPDGATKADLFAAADELGGGPIFFTQDSGLPTSHLGQALPRGIPALGRVYVEYLAEVFLATQEWVLSHEDA